MQFGPVHFVCPLAPRCYNASRAGKRERHGLNKQSASELGISEITVKPHRGKMMHKMKARTLPDLVRMAARLGVPT